MFSRLETQFVDEKPQVLLISEPSSLSRLIEHSLRHQDLDVIQVATRTVNEHFELPTEITQLYKIIWIHEPFEAQVSGQVVSEWLQHFSEPKVIITTQLSPVIETKPLFKEWVLQAQADQEFIEQIILFLPESTLLVGQDVFFSSKSFAPLSAMLAYLHHRALVDPGVVLTLQTAESFAQAIQPNLLSPLPHRVIVQGRRVVSTEVVKKLQRLYQRDHGVLPNVESIPTELSPLPSLAVVANPELEALEKFVDDVPRLFPLKPATRSHTEPGYSLASLPAPELVLPAAPLAVKPPLRSKPAVSRAVLSAPPQLPVVPIETIATPTVPEKKEPVMATGAVQPNRPVETSESIPRQKTASSQDVELENQVTELFQKYRSDHKVKRVQNLAQTTKTVSVKQKHKKKLFWAGLSFVGVGFGVMAIALFFVVSQSVLKSQVLAAVQSQLENSGKKIRTTSLDTVSQIVKTQVSAYTLVLEEHFFAQSTALARTGEVLATIPAKEQSMEASFSQAGLLLLGKDQGRSTAEWEKAALQAKDLYETFSQIQASLKTLAKTDLTSEQQAQLSAYEAWLTEQKKNLLPSQQLQPLLAHLLGEEAKRTYVIVLQNNQELRPTGGFIQALAVVTVDKGIITDTQVISSYDLDKNILGVVTPPPDLTRHLGEQQWYLRDSNWNPDFPTTSTQISWFVEKGTGKKVDGVVGLNLIVLKEILKTLGPLDLPEYNEVLTDRNLDERMEFHSEIQLVPDAAKPDYSTLVLTKLLQKVQQAPADKIVGLLSTTQAQLQSKQLLFSLTSTDENPSLAALGWTGALVKPACPTQLSGAPCFVDTIAQVETNVGVNKANAYITRSAKHSVTVNRQGFHHQRVMTFTNTASSPAWPKGTYKNYLRLYILPEAEVKQIKINDTVLRGDQLSIAIENKRKIVSFLVEVPVGQKVNVETEYYVPYPTSGSFSYTLFDQRQPGIEDPQLKVEVNHAPDLKPALIAPQAEVKGNTVKFESSALSHTFVGIQFN